MIRHIPVTGPLPPVLPYGWDYLYCRDGVGLRARRRGLELCMPLPYRPTQHGYSLRGLDLLRPYFTFEHPTVPAACLQQMVDLSRSAVCNGGSPVETLFYLRYSDSAWRLRSPQVEATSVSVVPVDRYDSDADIELHSHHAMTPRFSPRDDSDERGFRLYAVIGHLFTAPALHVRVGCFSHFWSVPARSVFEMPEGIADYLESADA